MLNGLTYRKTNIRKGKAMEVDEVKTKKIELEIELLILVKRFELETKTRIAGVHITDIGQTASGSRDLILVVECRL